MTTAVEVGKLAAKAVARALVRFAICVAIGVVLNWTILIVLLVQTGELTLATGFTFVFYALVLPLVWAVFAKGYAIRGAIAGIFEGRAKELGEWVRDREPKTGFAKWIARYLAMRADEAPEDLAGVSVVPFVLLAIVAIIGAVVMFP